MELLIVILHIPLDCPSKINLLSNLGFGTVQVWLILLGPNLCSCWKRDLFWMDHLFPTFLGHLCQFLIRPSHYELYWLWCQSYSTCIVIVKGPFVLPHLFSVVGAISLECIIWFREFSLANFRMVSCETWSDLDMYQTAAHTSEDTFTGVYYIVMNNTKKKLGLYLGILTRMYNSQSPAVFA